METDDPGAVGWTSPGTTFSILHSAGAPGGTYHYWFDGAWGGQVVAMVTVVDIQVKPASIIVLPGTQRQFFSEVTGSGQAVQWSTTVPGATISSTGLLAVPTGTATGTHAVTVQTVGTPVAPATAVVTVANALPVTGVAVAPIRSVIDEGQQQPFSAVVLGQNAELYANPAVSWSVSGPVPVSIPADGLFTAPAADGVYTVTATSLADPTRSGSATVVVGEDLTVQPSAVSLAPGASQAFTAQVSGEANPTTAWSVLEGAAGGTISAAGVYTAPATAGLYHVVAMGATVDAQLQGMATVSVGSNPEVSVTITPAEVSLVPGGTQQFTASVAGVADTSVAWTASAGTIDATGFFTAPPTYGTVTITAQSHANPQVLTSATAEIAGSGPVTSFQYDADGNLLNDGTRTYEWDAANRLTAVNIGTQRSEFGYDVFGRRVLITEKTNGTVTSSHHFIWVGNQMLEETDATSAPAAGPLGLGNFDAVSCNTIVGWAWNAAQPNTPISVDFYNGSTKVASTLANTFRSDVRAAGGGNGDHGFSYPLPAAFKTGTAQSVTIMLDGTSTGLGTRSVSCPAASLAGAFGEADCTQLAGWGWDATEPSSPIGIDIYDGSTLLTTVLANAFRQDLVNAGIGNGDHGFFLPTPVSLKNGASHAITLKAAGTSIVLGGTRSLTCPAPAFSGHIDFVDCTQIAGWAWDANQPNAAIDVDIYDGTTLLATIPASNFRQDLLNAGIGNGDHGFTYSTPALYTGSTHSITVNAGGSATTIAGTPATITCPNETILTLFFPEGMQSGPTSYYFSYDHLASVREVTTAGGAVVSRYDYDAYGRLTVNQGTPPRFGYAGMYYHQPSGLDLTRYRACDPDLGRWESRDPAGEQVDSNLYRYVENDPTDRTDPLGLGWVVNNSCQNIAIRNETPDYRVTVVPPGTGANADGVYNGIPGPTQGVTGNQCGPYFGDANGASVLKINDWDSIVVDGGCGGQPLQWHFLSFADQLVYYASHIPFMRPDSDGWKQAPGWYDTWRGWKVPYQLWPLVCSCPPPPVATGPTR